MLLGAGAGDQVITLEIPDRIKFIDQFAKWSPCFYSLKFTLIELSSRCNQAFIKGYINRWLLVNQKTGIFK